MKAMKRTTRAIRLMSEMRSAMSSDFQYDIDEVLKIKCRTIFV